MSIRSRVERLEGEAGVGGPCAECGCYPQGFDVRIYVSDDSQAEADADIRPAETCGACGLPKALIKVVYAHRSEVAA